LLDKLREIRFEMEDDPQRKWTVMELAKKAGLSPSRYSVLHREFFGAGPIDDLINMRLNYAKWLLTNTKMSVSEAAFESGFSNVCHFSQNNTTRKSPRGRMCCEILRKDPPLFYSLLLIYD
jgi:transcriptional regulator GlxA family with amidase domain